MSQDMPLTNVDPPGPRGDHARRPTMFSARAFEEFVRRLDKNIRRGTIGETGSRRGSSGLPETLQHQTSKDIPVPSSPNKALPELPRRPCGCTQRGRNLVVCIDGTSNKFGPNNTNVVELYSLLVKDGSQLTYYDSGIGTYAKPSWRKLGYLKRILDHKIDLAIAWNFDRILLGAYRWLAEHYREGDNVFLFGFSRGAYQVRALSAMIDRVGLIHRGNEAQIPFAFELFASIDDTRPPKDATTDRDYRQPDSPQPLPSKSDTEQVADHFKRTFSRVVQVHFVGAWQGHRVVCGLVCNKVLPGTASGMQHVCYFRHGLALDERRVKFLPEFVNGGTFKTDGGNAGPEKFVNSGEPHVKEVWFAGTHSDIGGGNVQNLRMDHSDPPLRWMSYEATKHGLLMHPFRGDWRLDKPIEVHGSLKGGWRLLEFLPIKRLSYKDSDSMVWWPPHLGKGRRMQPGQSIHSSVLRDNSGTYITRAVLPYPAPNRTENWKNLKDKTCRGLMQITVEDDLYSSVIYFVDRCKGHWEGAPLDKMELSNLQNQLTEVLMSAEGRRALHEVPKAAKYIVPLFWSEPSKASKRKMPAVFIAMDIRLLAAYLAALHVNEIYLVKEKKAANMSLSMAQNDELVKCEIADEPVMYLAIDHIDTILPRIFLGVEAQALRRRREVASPFSTYQPGSIISPTPMVSSSLFARKSYPCAVQHLDTGEKIRMQRGIDMDAPDPRCRRMYTLLHVLRRYAPYLVTI